MIRITAAAWEMRSGGGGCRIRGECPPDKRLAQSFLGMQGNPVEALGIFLFRFCS